jgi:hypothetical protein
VSELVTGPKKGAYSVYPHTVTSSNNTVLDLRQNPISNILRGFALVADGPFTINNRVKIAGYDQSTQRITNQRSCSNVGHA